MPPPAPNAGVSASLARPTNPTRSTASSTSPRRAAGSMLSTPATSSGMSNAAAALMAARQSSTAIVYAASEDGVIFALDAASGTQKWQYPTGAQMSNIAVNVQSDGTLYIGASDGYLYSAQREHRRTALALSDVIGHRVHVADRQRWSRLYWRGQRQNVRDRHQQRRIQVVISGWQPDHRQTHHRTTVRSFSAAPTTTSMPSTPIPVISSGSTPPTTA